jgi:hypothetical protein
LRSNNGSRQKGTGGSYCGAITGAGRNGTGGSYCGAITGAGRMEPAAVIAEQ